MVCPRLVAPESTRGGKRRLRDLGRLFKDEGECLLVLGGYRMRFPPHLRLVKDP